jgi:hypothetical protein
MELAGVKKTHLKQKAGGDKLSSDAMTGVHALLARSSSNRRLWRKIRERVIAVLSDPRRDLLSHELVKLTSQILVQLLTDMTKNSNSGFKVFTVGGVIFKDEICEIDDLVDKLRGLKGSLTAITGFMISKELTGGRMGSERRNMAGLTTIVTDILTKKLGGSFSSGSTEDASVEDLVKKLKAMSAK